MRLLIARHAEDKGSKYEDEERILTERGIEQAKELAKTIIKFHPTHIYSSSLKRAKQTAQIISKACRITFKENYFFNEQKSGNGLKGNSVNNGYIDFKDAFEDGETYKDLNQRAKDAFNLLQCNHSNSPEDRVILITHGRFMTFLISIILGFKPDGFNLAIANCSYVIVKITEDWRPQLILPISGSNYI